MERASPYERNSIHICSSDGKCIEDCVSYGGDVITEGTVSELTQSQSHNVLYTF